MSWLEEGPLGVGPIDRQPQGLARRTQPDLQPPDRFDSQLQQVSAGLDLPKVLAVDVP
jgi:hypothetical protein